MMVPVGMETSDDLRYVIEHCPIIDNHAHNLLLPAELKSQPFETITTEATGSALGDTFSSLAHIRAVRQLKALYLLEGDADWNRLTKKRSEWLRDRPEELFQRCLAGTHAILIDDGLGDSDKVHPYDWHSQWTAAPAKRIVRIETVAEQLLQEELRDISTTHDDHPMLVAKACTSFWERFKEAISAAIQDGEVAGFKSVICYRSGLQIESDHAAGKSYAEAGFRTFALECVQHKSYRVQMKAMNDFLVLETLRILTESATPSRPAKPIQFHTGLGDNDISLLHSNPAYMQPLIERYPSVPFVVLHSSYPYTQEAGYLAMAFKNVYLDLGEVFPMVSRDGQETILRQALELVPFSKLLWSTDGHHFPETYWLANVQFRDALKKVLIKYVHKEDMSAGQAIELTKKILFENANSLYHLNFTLEMPEPGLQALRSLRRKSIFDPQASDRQMWRTFQSRDPANFVYAQWLDAMGTVRGRVIPVEEFSRLVDTGDCIKISKGNMGTLQDDTITPVCNATGQIYVKPDLSTLRRTVTKTAPRAARVLCYWHHESGERINECPRGSLASVLDDLYSEFGVNFLVGFEIEVVFLRRQRDPPSSNSSNTNNDNNSSSPYEPISKTHAWGSFTPEDMRAMPMLAEITSRLADIGIQVQQFHSESGAGQYEFIMSPLPALEAVDALVHTRLAMQEIAENYGFRATLHPQPFGTATAGTGAHMHISFQPPDLEMTFWAGVLAHLGAIAAFTMPQAVSYGRVVDDSWTGGSWIGWGQQNRETPLRRVGDCRWEVRCVDGTANTYFALGALMRGGLLGLREKRAMTWTDCALNPARMTGEQRKEHGIEKQLPRDIYAALDELEKDKQLAEALPEGLVERYLVMKRVEQRKLEGMGSEERRTWLTERY